jgi:RND family efflux transporter MFP subunit
MNFFKKYYKFSLIFIFSIAVISWFIVNMPKPDKVEEMADIPSLTFTNVILQDQSIPVFSRGKVSATNIRHITSEVPGLVVYKNPKLVRGAFVEKDELLIKLDQQPFILDIAQKQSALDQAKLHLSETQAKARIAKKSAGKKSSKYAKHVPQLKFAQSQVNAALAALNYAKNQLEKTEIKTPIAGKVIDDKINQGEYLQSLSAISKIYGTQVVEVRLPLNDHQIDILGLKENTHDLAINSESIKVKVNSFHDPETVWHGTISRIEGERDNNQLLYVIASFDNFSIENQRNKALLPGSFIEARINGKIIKGLRILPRALIQGDKQVWIINQENRLERKKVNILYRGKELVYIRSGLQRHDKVVNTSFHQLISGLLVEPSSQPSILDQPVVEAL